MTRIAIIIPSLGRSEVLSKTLTLLAAQSRPADHICVVVTNPEDAPTIPDTGNIDVLYAAIGSCAQRNAGIDQTIGASDIITFLDDDFVPSSDYLETLVEIFTTRPEIAGLTGHVLADGVIGPGLSFEDADRILDNRHNPQSRARQKETREPSLYGCNMSFRRSAIEDVRFDERLPFYGWLEDVDFSVQAGRRGHLIKTPRLQGVHLGVKGGRTSGLRFGYSQMMNPVYLLRKGTIGFPQASANFLRTFAANHIKVLRQDPLVDRRGRIRGNWIAIGDILRGRITPERITSL